MEPKTKALEFKVGLFVFTGLLVIAVMVAKFGRIGQGFRDFYSLTVEFPHAGGIIRNSDVQLAGTRIGFVADTPAIKPDMTGVRVPLSIQSAVKIPKKMRFVVGSSGLLGDKYVELVPGEGFDAAKFDEKDPEQVLAEGTVIQGSSQMGLQELQEKGVEVLDALKSRADELQETIKRVNTGILTDQNASNLTATMENLRKTSESFAEASNKLKGVVESSGTVVATAQNVMTSAQKTMTTVDGAAGELRTTVTDARKVIDSANSLLRNASTGQGMLGALVSDKKLADDLRVFVANLRQRGVLFYKDSKVEPRATPGGNRRSEPAR